jgi:hypothetical protein
MYEDRANWLAKMSPHLVADVELFSTEDGGKTFPAVPGWGCPCLPSDKPPLVGFDAWPLLGDTPLAPGEQRRVGFVFFLPAEKAVNSLSQAGTFYLWEGRVIGRAVVVERS